MFTRSIALAQIELVTVTGNDLEMNVVGAGIERFYASTSESESIKNCVGHNVRVFPQPHISVVRHVGAGKVSGGQIGSDRAKQMI